MKNKASKNVSAFRFKRKCVLFETQVRFDQNARTFELKRTCVFLVNIWLFILHFLLSLFSGFKEKLLYLYIQDTKLLQKREMRKDIVIELSYKGFSRASDYS